MVFFFSYDLLDFFLMDQPQEKIFLCGASSSQLSHQKFLSKNAFFS